MQNLEIFQLSSLAKAFPVKIYGNEIENASIAKGQSFSYQIAFRGDVAEYSFEIKSPIKDFVKVYKVGLVPMTMPTYDKCNDEDYLTREKGLCPDYLEPVTGNSISVDSNFSSLWISLDNTEELQAGEYDFIFEINKDGEIIGSKTFTLTVKDVVLPKQKTMVTQWFHTDCIADVHGVEVFSEEHWALIEEYVRVAREHGINMLLTPVLTPPLDTEEGGERTTVQLVKIEKNGKKYSFDFSNLERFVALCQKAGIEYFEINHMFTQWGAKHAPKVIATVDGKSEKIFGWETNATSKEYKSFLKKLVPGIIETLVKCGVNKENIYFHVSDEPGKWCFKEYKKAYKILKKLIKGCQQVDALSSFEFYKKKVIKTPIVATSSIEPFLEEKVNDLWCYYCCAQNEKVANRFMAMPSWRNRIIGVQMYKCSIVGFLQWGYNFYNTQYSKKKINPYEVTDAGGAFPSGDSFSVYPYNDTAIPSLRIKVFKNALEDIQLLNLLEERVGRQTVVELIDRVAECEITFKNYPKSEEFFTKLYEEIFKILCSNENN